MNRIPERSVLASSDRFFHDCLLVAVSFSGDLTFGEVTLARPEKEVFFSGWVVSLHDILRLSVDSSCYPGPRLNYREIYDVFYDSSSKEVIEYREQLRRIGVPSSTVNHVVKIVFASSMLAGLSLDQPRTGIEVFCRKWEINQIDLPDFDGVAPVPIPAQNG